MPIKQRLVSLRAAMARHTLHAWIIPSADPHSGEYTPEHWQGRTWASGFTGSAGTLVLLDDKAGLWTDGRYHIQAADELANTGIDLFNAGLPDTPSIIDWLVDTLPEGARIGFDGKVISHQFKQSLLEKCAPKSISLHGQTDLLNEAWPDRPSLPTDPIFELPLKYAGTSRVEKLAQLRADMSKRAVNTQLITTLDDIAWLYNYRGTDIPYCPVALAYAVVTENQAWLFIDKTKVPADLNQAFEADGITVAEYGDIDSVLSSLPNDSRILFDPAKANSYLTTLFPSVCETQEGVLSSTRLKAEKNDIEIEQVKECHRKDGAAVSQFLHWLDLNVVNGEVSELSATAKLQSLRENIDTFRGLSFNTFAGYGPHGAMMHYAANEESNVPIGNDSFFLVDSGGQYWDGNTDITRTQSYGPLSDAQKRDYTLVVRAHIQLCLAKFMRGTRGIQLDMLARQPLWREGINFGCGTGHGVGSYLNVHEGPHNISPGFIDEALMPGMYVTNEPGIYRTGEHGVRIENIMLVVEGETTEFGQFYEFEQLTLCPIDTSPLLLSMLLDEERDYLNGYHQRVFESLSPLMDEAGVKWLKEQTRAV